MQNYFVLDLSWLRECISLKATPVTSLVQTLSQILRFMLAVDPPWQL